MKILPLALLLSLFAPLAHADDVTFEVAGTMVAFPDSPVSCTGCAIAGSLVIDTSSGAVLSTDVTVAALGVTFDDVGGVGDAGGLTVIRIQDASGDLMDFDFPGSSNPVSGLIGYTGGDFWGDGYSEAVIDGVAYSISGTLSATTAPAAPEPSTAALALCGILALVGHAKRRTQGE